MHHKIKKMHACMMSLRMYVCMHPCMYTCVHIHIYNTHIQNKMQKLNSMKPGFRKLKRPTRWFVGFFLDESVRRCQINMEIYMQLYSSKRQHKWKIISRRLIVNLINKVLRFSLVNYLFFIVYILEFYLGWVFWWFLGGFM